MLFKWLLVFVLAVEFQNISGSFLGNYIDVNKFRVFSDPNTRMALKGALEKVGRNPFPAIGFRGVKCKCEDYICGCCNGINITTFNFERHACTNFTYYPEKFGIKLNLLINEKEVLSTGLISGQNPPAFCVPVYPPISFCVHVYNISTNDKHLHACVDLEAHVVTWPILRLHFDCVKIGADGFSVVKPEGSNVPNMELAMLQPEVNGPEIFDQVDFEPGSEFPNNPAPNMTPEGENNIGQLKL